MWNRVTINRAAHKSTRYYIDEMHLLLKEEQTAAYTVEIWKRFRKWGGVPTGPVIVLTLFAIFVCSLLFAPRRSILTRAPARRRARLALRDSLLSTGGAR